MSKFEALDELIFCRELDFK